MNYVLTYVLFAELSFEVSWMIYFHAVFFSSEFISSNIERLWPTNHPSERTYLIKSFYGIPCAKIKANRVYV